MKRSKSIWINFEIVKKDHHVLKGITISRKPRHHLTLSKTAIYGIPISAQNSSLLNAAVFLFDL
tara:strand:- start:2741 stop:2932 length:192 start_codon:yes stop_codon:yes gene_type:complete